MFDLHFYLQGLALVLVLAWIAWIVSLRKGDVSIVDSLWSLFLLALGATYFVLNEFSTQRGIILMFLLSVWAIRLSLYITWRNWGEEEDARYQAIRRRHEPNFAFKSLFIVFLLQGALAWIISLPLLAAVTGSRPLHLVDLLGALLVLFGILFESIADAQLANFKANADNRGKVLHTGLWRYTRHPNYFGECCVWWGFYVLALAAGGWWTLLSPLLMTFLLLRVSGVTLLEKDIVERRPGYQAYIAGTNAFFPGMSKTNERG